MSEMHEVVKVFLSGAISKSQERFSSFLCGQSPLLPLEKGAGGILIHPKNSRNIAETYLTIEHRWHGFANNFCICHNLL